MTIALGIEPDHYWGHWLLAEILAQERDYNGAIREAKVALLLGHKDEGDTFQYKKILEALIQKWEIQLRIQH